MASEGMYENYTELQALSEPGKLDVLFKAEMSEARYIYSDCLPENKSARILSVGCGFGIQLLVLAKLGYNTLLGVDLSSQQVELAKELVPNADIACEDALSYVRNLESKSVDMVLIFDLLEHLNPSLSIDLLKEVKRCLSDNGNLVIRVPNIQSPFSPNQYGDITHITTFSPRTMRQLLRMSGHLNVQCVPCPFRVSGVLTLGRKWFWNLFFLPILFVYLCCVTGSFKENILTLNFIAKVKNY